MTRTRQKLCRLLLLLLLAAGCESEPGRDSSPQPSAAPQLISAIISDPKTFNPILVTDSASSNVVAHLFESLVRLDYVTLEIEPSLAERWETSDDGKVWTFHLRRNVRWHDGEPFTADDVVFTFAAVFDDRVPNSTKHTLMIDGKPIRVEAVDAHTVRFHLPRPFAPFLHSSQVGIVPKHKLAGALADGSFAQRWGINTPPAEIVGTGPYRLTQYVQAQIVRFERNTDYWQKDDAGVALPYIDKRMILLVPDQNTSYLKFLAGEMTIHQPRPEEVSDLKQRADTLGIEVREVGLSSSSQFVVFNRNPQHYEKGGRRDPKLDWFTDVHFLRALAHAVDKQAMVINCLAGYGKAAVSYISPADTVFHHPGLEEYAYDLDAARKQLDAGGYILVDGRLQDRNGTPVEFSLTTNAGNKIRERISAILQEDWGKLGIKVNYRPVDFTALVEKLDTTLDWDAILIGFTSSPEPHSGANLLRSSANLHMWHPNQKQPASEWEAEIDALVQAAAHELDRDQRRRHYWRIQEILHEQLPMIQTVRAIEHYAYKRGLTNFEPTVWDINEPERIRFAP